MNLLVRVVSWILGAVIALGAAGFVSLMVVLGTSTPFTATVGHSMNPLLFEGDLAVVKAIEPNKLKVGDIVRVNITAANQKQFGLPSTILHRVVAIRNSDTGLMFTTKGDNNPLNDTFETRADNITGTMIAHYSHLGYAMLMTQSPTAPYLGYVALALIAAYILIAWLESAMNAAKLREQTLRELVGEIPELKTKIDQLTAQLAGPKTTYVSYFDRESNGVD